MFDDITKIHIDDSYVTGFDVNGKQIISIDADMVANNFFNHGRLDLGRLKASVRWISDSHCAILLERPPKMAKLLIKDNLYYLPVPWTVTANVFDMSNNVLSLSKVFFSKSQIFSEDDILYYVDLPIYASSDCMTSLSENMGINLNPEEEEIMEAISPDKFFNRRFSYSLRSFNYKVSVHPSNLDSNLDNETAYFKYLDQLSRLSLRDGLFVERNEAGTVGGAIEALKAYDRIFNSSFYDTSNSFDLIKKIMISIYSKQMDFLHSIEEEAEEYEAEEYEGEVEESPY